MYIFSLRVLSILISSFKTKHLLNSHLAVHSDFQFKCPQCDKMFRKKQGLKRHMEFHAETIVKPFVCDYCEKSFRRNSDLRVCIHILKFTHFKLPNEK